MYKKMTRPKTWIKWRSPVFYIRILVFLALIYVILDLTQLYSYSRKVNTNAKSNIRNYGFSINTSGCYIPFMYPFDKSILKYVYEVKPFQCSNIPPLVSSDTTSLYLDLQKLSYYNISDYTTLSCCYQPFQRANPHADVADNLYTFYECVNFTSNVKIDAEYVKVVCKANRTEIYKDYHSFVPVRKYDNVIEHIMASKINVLVIGLDSVSRLNFERQLPRTRKFLYEKLHAVEMFGYNKVGYNTFPNVIPILTGLSVEELKRTCWKTKTSKFDKCPFIWKQFTRAGYLTGFGEDASWMGIFNYLMRGFEEQPTDYYWRTFNYIAEKEIGHNRPYNAKLCLGTRPVYAVFLDYISKFVKSIKYRPYFGFFWGASLSHDDLNYPSLGDDTYLSFFKTLYSSEVLNKTVLIFLSDHGMRWGDILTTQQGYLEERMPFLFFILPKWFSKTYPTATANLRVNSRRLTTPFDLHETLFDISNVNQLTCDQIERRSMRVNSKRGISLFLSVPENRTCSSAGISADWCICQNNIEIDKNITINQEQ